MRAEAPKLQYEEKIITSNKPLFELLNISTGVYSSVGQINRIHLGDRVVSIAETGCVPFGTRGK
jgi:hypothetical protein